MKNYSVHFYLYKGNWSDLFSELMELLLPDEERKFAIWAPVDKAKEYCLIVTYGMPLTCSYCYQKNIWATSENIFNAFYLPQKGEFRIYGYKESDEYTLPTKRIA